MPTKEPVGVDEGVALGVPAKELAGVDDGVAPGVPEGVAPGVEEGVGPGVGAEEEAGLPPPPGVGVVVVVPTNELLEAVAASCVRSSSETSCAIAFVTSRNHVSRRASDSPHR